MPTETQQKIREQVRSLYDDPYIQQSIHRSANDESSYWRGVKDGFTFVGYEPPSFLHSASSSVGQPPLQQVDTNASNADEHTPPTSYATSLDIVPSGVTDSLNDTDFALGTQGDLSTEEEMQKLRDACENDDDDDDDDGDYGMQGIKRQCPSLDTEEGPGQKRVKI